MSELILYIEVIQKLGFKNVIKPPMSEDVKDNLHPLFSRSGIIEFGYHKEISDEEYWEEKLKENTYSIWASNESGTHSINRYGKKVNSINPKDDTSFIIIGYNLSSQVTYLESIVPGNDIRSFEMDKEAFYNHYKHLFRDIKIDTLT